MTAAMTLGKLPARPNSVILNFADYLDRDASGAMAVGDRVPATFGPGIDVPSFGLLGSDRTADGVVAGAAYEAAIVAAWAGDDVTFDQVDVLADYAAVSGYDSADPGTDRGVDVQRMAAYRQKIGVLDTAGNRHRVGAYLSVRQGDPAELAAAVFIFGYAGVGLRVPDYVACSAPGQVWETRHGVPTVVGGAYVTVLGRADRVFDVLWCGRSFRMSVGFYRRYCDEAIVYLPLEFLTTTQSPPGFDRARLMADLTAHVRS